MDTQQLQPKKVNWIALIIIGGLLYVVGQFVASQPQRIKQEVEANREITVSGYGEVTSIPDVARLTLGVTTGPQSSAQVAIKLLTTRFTAVADELRKAGIDEKDLKTTNLSVNPLYDYREGRQTLRGYEASESVLVTIRDLDSIGDVLARTTSEGVNQAGGISFEIDDPKELRREAQEEAIDDARENAKKLAKALGVSLGRVKTFSVSSAGVPQPFYARAELSALTEDVAGPPVPAGEQDVTATVSVTFELR